MRAVACAAIGSAALVSAWHAQPEQQAAASAGCSWSVERNGPGPKLNAVSPVGREVWAVGVESGKPAVLRRQRGVWKRMVLPAKAGALNAIASARGGVVWAVGNVRADFTERPLVLRWSGGRWQQVRAPRRNGLATLEAVHARGPVWVAGGDYASGVYKPYVLQRRTSRGWVTDPGSRIAEGLIEAIDSTSASDAWAVGYQGGAGSITTIDALALHWDGRRWQPTRLPTERLSDPNGDTVDSLNDVAVAPSHGAWAVGSDQVGGVAFRWDGRRWTRTPMSNAPRALFAVASRGTQTLSVGSGPTVLRWAGSRWEHERVADSQLRGSLNDLAIASADESWAVGGSSEYDGGPTRTLVLHRSCR